MYVGLVDFSVLDTVLSWRGTGENVSASLEWFTILLDRQDVTPAENSRGRTMQYKLQI